MKYLVETPGAFSLHDLSTMQTVAAFRPTVIKPSQFLENQFGKKLTKLDVLTDEASDEALARAKTPEELEEAIAALPRPDVATKAAAAKK